MQIKIDRYIHIYILIFFIMSMEIQFFYLIPVNTIIFGIDYTSLISIFEIILFILMIIQKRGKLLQGKNKWFIYFGLFLIFTSAYAGTLSYGQSIMTGFIVQRSRTGNFLFYFVLYNWYNDKKITISGLKKMIMFFAAISATIYILQYFMSDIAIFTYSTTNMKVRYGSIRFWFNYIYIAFAAILSFDEMMRLKKYKKRNIVFIALPFLIALFIVKTRTGSIALFFALSIAFVLQKSSKKKWMIGVGLIIGICSILSFSSIGNDLMNTLLGGKSEEDTLTVRDVGREYFIAQTLQNPISAIIGCGYASSNNANALNIAYPTVYNSSYGYKVMYYPQDNGLMGQFLFYGLLGVGWWFLIIIKLLKNGYNILKKSRNSVFVFFAVYEICLAITSIPILFSSYCIISLLFIMLEDENFKVSN